MTCKAIKVDECPSTEHLPQHTTACHRGEHEGCVGFVLTPEIPCRCGCGHCGPYVNVSRYPLRCDRCRYCGNDLRKDSPNRGWADAWNNDKCDAAPVNEDGGAGGHVPDAVVLAKPADMVDPVSSPTIARMA